jgi:hypothetical protein
MVVMVIAGVACADAYRWVDKDGNVVFSQSPPPEQQETERIRLPVTQAFTEEEPEESETVDSEESEKTKKPASIDDLDPAVRKDYCDRAKQNVELLENTDPGTAFLTEDKTIIRFSEEERAKRMKLAKKAMEAYCITDKPTE